MSSEAMSCLPNVNNSTRLANVCSEDAFFGRDWKWSGSTSLGLLLFVTLYMVFHQYKFRNPKGPWVWPILGNMPDFIQNVHRLYDWMAEMQLEHGGTVDLTFFFPFGDLQKVNTARPENVEYITQTHHENFIKSDQNMDLFRELLGHGIFNTNGERWRIQRKIIAPMFTMVVLRESTLPLLRSGLETKLLPIVKEGAETGMIMDLQQILFRFGFDSVCGTVLGLDPKSLAKGFPSVPFAEAWDTVTSTNQERCFTPKFIWQIKRALQVGSEGRFLKALKVVDETITKTIKARRAQLEQGIGVERLDLLTKFMKLSDEEGKSPDDQFLRDTTTNMLLAGRDTVSMQVNWFLWLVTQHPEVEANIVKELNEIKRPRSPERQQDTTFSFVELGKMTYLHAALNEAARLYPSLPWDFRFAVEDDVLPDGVKVKKDQGVIWSMYTMGRMPELWGDDCLEFKPERWFDGHGGLKSVSPLKFSAFSSGPRNCFGKDLAYLFMKSVSAALLSQYSIQVAPGHKVQYALSIILLMEKGLPVTFHARLK
ncbi:hypothetical protein Mapa_015628 [Marchantia paleacea]|nr:hypothetical protein Mapa_015628 [Marchantia paleacea]